MENIEHGRPIEFIRHRRESGGYEKVTTDTLVGVRTYSQLKGLTMNLTYPILSKI